MCSSAWSRTSIGAWGQSAAPGIALTPLRLDRRRSARFWSFMGCPVLVDRRGAAVESDELEPVPVEWFPTTGLGDRSARRAPDLLRAGEAAGAKRAGSIRPPGGAFAASWRQWGTSREGNGGKDQRRPPAPASQRGKIALVDRGPQERRAATRAILPTLAAAAAADRARRRRGRRRRRVARTTKPVGRRGAAAGAALSAVEARSGAQVARRLSDSVLDLHGLTQAEAHHALRGFLFQAQIRTSAW